MTPGRRPLSFENFDQIMPDVERLLGGCSTVGNWSLAQICRHLSAALRGTADLPRHDATGSFFVGIREELRRQIFESGQLLEGYAAASAMVPEDAPCKKSRGGGAATIHRLLQGVGRTTHPAPIHRAIDEGGVGSLPSHPCRTSSQLCDPERLIASRRSTRTGWQQEQAPWRESCDSTRPAAPKSCKIEEIEVPPPGKGEVQIRIQALGLNRAESMFRSGQYLEEPKLPARLGYEAAGTVAADRAGRRRASRSATRSAPSRASP